MKNPITILIIITISMPVLAQMHIDGKAKQINESFEPRWDINGRLCSVIKVVSDRDGFKYDSRNGIVGAVIDKPGKDYVYVSPDERAMDIYHTGFPKLTVFLSEAGIQLAENQIWEIRLSTERVVSLDLLPVTLLIIPEDASVFIDKQAMGRGPTFQLEPGKHAVSIQKEGYLSTTDHIEVSIENVLFNYQLVIQPDMVPVEGGVFDMGDTFGDGDDDEKPVHKVTLSSFEIGKTEVTQSQWVSVMGSNPASFRGDSLPIGSVNWYDVVEFCNKLSSLSGLSPCYTIDKTRKDPNNTSSSDDVKWLVSCDFSANGYRLPTEAEWEYACRGGKQSAGYKYSGSNNVHEVAWYSGNSDSKTHPVGQKKANELSIYDMSGNIYEWCWDWYSSDFYSNSPLRNPQGPSSGSSRVQRGGSWGGSGVSWRDFGEGSVRCALRIHYYADGRDISFGFRLCRTVVEE